MLLLFTHTCFELLHPQSVITIAATVAAAETVLEAVIAEVVAYAYLVVKSSVFIH